MPHKSETPRNGGASRNSCGGCFHDALTLSTIRAQHLIGRYAMRPEIAVMFAAMVFGGHGHG